MSKQKSQSKLKYIIIAVVVFIAALVAGFFIYQNTQNNQSEPQIIEENNNTIAINSETAEPEKEEPEPEKNLPTQYEGENPNQASELSGIISQARVIDNNLRIRTNIDQFLSDGTCSLTISSGEKNFTTSANIIAMVSTSTCDGFDIPVSNLPSGHLDIKIELSSSGKNGEINGEANV